MTQEGARPPRTLRARLAVALLPVALAACASGGTGSAGSAPILLPSRSAFEAGDFTNQPSAIRDTVIVESRERVWLALPQVFRTLGVEATTLDDRTFAIGNREWRPSAIHGTRLSSFLQCGSGVVGPNADRYEVTMQLLVQLEAPAAGSTRVRTLVDAFARPRDAGGTPIHCASFGTLEGRIIRLIDEALAAPAAYLAAGAPMAGATGGRLPSMDEFVRVGCSDSPSAAPREAEGRFEGVSAGVIQLGLGPTRQSLAVPVTHVVSIQIREERSKARLGAVLGAVLGGAAGAWRGNEFYNPDADYHFPRAGTTFIGGVIGVMGGALLGGLTGSLFDQTSWVDATPAWQMRYQAVAPAEAPPPSIGCPGAAF